VSAPRLRAGSWRSSCQSSRPLTSSTRASTIPTARVRNRVAIPASTPCTPTLSNIAVTAAESGRYGPQLPVLHGASCGEEGEVKARSLSLGVVPTNKPPFGRAMPGGSRSHALAAVRRTVRCAEQGDTRSAYLNRSARGPLAWLQTAQVPPAAHRSAPSTPGSEAALWCSSQAFCKSALVSR
jgi:hypothetical protein